MNYSTAVMLINEKIRAVTVIDNSIEEQPSQTRYAFKTLDTSIEVDDLVIVPTDTRHGLTVVQVSEVDVDVDFESTTQIKWIVDKVDAEGNERILLEEKEWVDALKVSEKRRKKAELREGLVETYGDDLEKLPIASMNSAVAIEHVKEEEIKSDGSE